MPDGGTRTCSSCGSTNPSEANFCMRCGSQVVDSASTNGDTARPVWSGGLRFVSVLFCDLVNSTQVAQLLEPDRWAAYLDRYFVAVSRVITAFGGRVEKFIGDAVVGVFGLGADADAAARDAVESALGIVERVAQLTTLRAPDGTEVPVRVRVAIASGHVATAERASSFVIGPVLNRAARLQGAAPPDGTIVDMAAWLQIREVFRTTELEPVPAKGFAAPLPAWLVSGEVIAYVGSALIGRDEVIEALDAALRLEPDGPAPSLSAVVGEAGVGKSRVVAELVRRLPADWTCVVVPCSRHDAQLGLLPMYQLLGELERVEPRPPNGVARLIRVGGRRSGSSASERAAHHDRNELYESIMIGLSRLHRPGRLLLVVEDSHRMSEPMARLVERLATDARLAGAHLLLVGRSVPDHLEPHRLVTLTPLPSTAARELASHLLDVHAPAAVEAHAATAADPLVFIDVAEGNPLFIEQLIQLARFGAVDWQAPPSAHAAVGARVDGLSQEARGLVAVLAVHGDSMSIEDMEALAGPRDLSGPVAELLAAHLLDGPTASDGSLRLASSLVADVVARRLTGQELHQIHRTIADRLHENLIHQPASIEVLAHHRQHAYRTLRDDVTADPAGIGAAAAAAVEAWCLTARFAVSRGEIGLARIALGQAGLAAAADPALTASVRAIEAYASGHNGEVEAALALAATAHSAGVPAVDIRAYLSELYAGAVATVDLPDYAEVLALARSTGDSEAMASAHLFAGITQMRRGDYNGAHGWLNTALAHADVTLYCLGTTELYANLGLAAVFGDSPARTALRTCTGIMRRSAGSQFLSAVSGATLALSWHQCGRWRAAADGIARVRAELTALGHGAGVTQTYNFDALFAARQGDWAGAAQARTRQYEGWIEREVAEFAGSSWVHAEVARVAGGISTTWDPADTATAATIAAKGSWEDRVLAGLARAAQARIGGDWIAVDAAITAVIDQLNQVYGAGARTVPLLTAAALLRGGPNAALGERVAAGLRMTLTTKRDRGVAG